MITKDDVKKLAELSRISLTEEEVDKMTVEVSSILGYVEQIKEVSSEVDFSVPEHRNVLRDDVPVNEPGQYSESILKNAPDSEGDYFKVKKILGNSDDVI